MADELAWLRSTPASARRMPTRPGRRSGSTGTTARRRGPPLEGAHTVDLAIVGAGFTGLWAAVQALEDMPGREVVVLEGERVAFGASGRNGGFCEASLTHGLENGLRRFPAEIERIEQEGRENLDGITQAIERHGIDCAWEPTGTLAVATEPHQVQWCRDAVPHLTAYGHDVSFLDREAVRAEVNSPLYLGGFWRKDGGACIDPARLAWGLAAAAERLGARIHEQSMVTSIEDDGDGVIVRTRARAGARPPGDPRHERVPTPAEEAAALHPAGLRLRLDDRALWDPSGRPRSAGRIARAWPT